MPAPVAPAPVIGHERGTKSEPGEAMGMVDEVKALNEAIADDYSAHVYDPVPVAFLDVERLDRKASCRERVWRYV